MLLNREDVEKLCLLSRLEITPEEMEDVSAKLSDIVNMVKQLQAAETTGVLPMAHPLDQAQRMREDKATETDHHEKYQQNASLVERDLYLVPKVID
ncbi:MAG: Asp-tRNA(Asn)/Glu-tRNA(Gln) amidotransferase subunit GatC [Candidatus Rariloculaceae bacterium]|nr:Asp-tRNA(Asn)/Glu-tRNA(Gln) amidotransferase subunit GatC [Gammaproteobacteria bacterium]